jgi:hypothetical protein
MRSTSPVSLISSTSTKDAVCGASVGGRVSQTRGVTLSAPNCTVSLIGISRCEMRPVTLSRAANTAIWFLMISARASAEPSTAMAAARLNSRARWAKAASNRCIMLKHL